MKLQDVERIDGLIVQIDKILMSRPIFLGCLEGDLDEVVKINAEDLEFLKQKEYVSTLSSDELSHKYEIRPDNFGGLRREYDDQHSKSSELKRECEQLRSNLRGLRRLFTSKTTISQREDRLRHAEEGLERLALSCNNLNSKYERIKYFIRTDGGVYLNLTDSHRDVKRFVDLSFEPTKTTARNNSMRGKLVIFYPKGLCDEWFPATGVPDPKPYGEEVQLELNVPFERLTEVEDLSIEPYVSQLGGEIIESIRLHYCENCPSDKANLIIGALNLPDRRYLVTCELTPQEQIVKGEEILVGKTTGNNYVGDFGPMGYHTVSVPLDYYARTLEGTFTFSLVFERIKARRHESMYPYINLYSYLFKEDALSKPFISVR